MEDKRGFAVSERIRLYAKEHGIKMVKMEESLGKKNSYLKKVKNPTAEVLVTLCERYPDITPEWLLLGIKHDEEEQKKSEYLMNELAKAKMEIEQLKMEIHLLKNME